MTDCCCCVSTLIYGVGIVVILKTVIPLVLSFINGKKKPEPQEKAWKKDTVYLYQMHGTSTLPSVSPYCIKVETFLRLHKLKFERRYLSLARGSNGKLPFIELNGEHIADSEVIFTRLAKHFKINEYANAQDAALGHATARLADNHTFNLFLLYKTSHGGTALLSGIVGPAVPGWLMSVIGPLVPIHSMMVARLRESFGEFTEEELDALVEKDLETFQTLLGDKKFLLGSEITSVDCSVFGHIAALFYLGVDCHPVRLINSARFGKLKAYVQRVRDVFGSEFHA